MSEFRTWIINRLSPLSQSNIGKRLVVWFILHLHTIFPMNPLLETTNLLVYFHPQPSYPFHLIMVPKTDIRDLHTMDILENSGFIQEVLSATQKIVADYHLEESGYRLIVNGGKNQDFPILHFHLVSDQSQPGRELKHESL